MPWNQKSDAAVKITCSKVEQYAQYQKEYQDISGMEIGWVLKQTNCKLPCSYRIIKPIGAVQIY